MTFACMALMKRKVNAIWIISASSPSASFAMAWAS